VIFQKRFPNLFRNLDPSHASPARLIFFSSSQGSFFFYGLMRRLLLLALLAPHPSGLLSPKAFPIAFSLPPKQFLFPRSRPPSQLHRFSFPLFFSDMNYPPVKSNSFFPCLAFLPAASFGGRGLKSPQRQIRSDQLAGSVSRDLVRQPKLSRLPRIRVLTVCNSPGTTGTLDSPVIMAK